MILLCVCVCVCLQVPERECTRSVDDFTLLDVVGEGAFAQVCMCVRERGGGRGAFAQVCMCV